MLAGFCQALMSLCQPYSEVDPSVSSSTQEMGTGLPIFTSSATIAKQSSGSIPYSSRGATASAGKRSTDFGTWSSTTRRHSWRVGMSSFTVENRMARATAVVVSEDTLTVDLADGRTLAAPVAWYPRL